MTNQISKLQSHPLQGMYFLSAVSEDILAIESRTENQLFYSVFDLVTGRLLSEIPARLLSPWYTLSGTADGRLILQHFESRQNPDQVKLFVFDFWKNTLLNEIPEAPPQPIVQSPTFFHETSADFGLFKQLIGPELVLGCEYQEVNTHVIISYYVRTGTSFCRFLLILTDGQEVYRDVQDEEMKGIALGSFFTFQNRLIFVRHTRELIIHEI